MILDLGMTPSPTQLRFLQDRHKYVCFGGARGGGKSWGVRIKAILSALYYAGIRIIIVRRSYPELKANHIDPMTALLAGKSCARYNAQNKEFRFTNGSLIKFGYCDNRADMLRYQGDQYDMIFLEEATQWDEEIFTMFSACLRGVNDFPKRMYLTCNPGGRGHAWVKRLFIDRKFKPGENPDEYSFIQSLVTDNLALMRMQPEYVKQLDNLPPKLLAAWRYGDWTVFEGQYFEEFRDDPEHYDDHRFTHIITPFDPPRDWTLYRSFDWGYVKPYSCGWWAVSHKGVMYRIAELYGCTGEPDEGVKQPADKVFDEIKRVESEHPYLKGRRVLGIADPSIWDGSRDEHGVSISDMAARKGIYFEPGNNARIPGWMQLHYRLAFDEYGAAKLYAFTDCHAFRRTIPLLCHSETRPEDIDTKQEDHVGDETRYMCMRNPINPPEYARPAPKGYNPLDIYDYDNSPSDKTLIYRL